jgi:hypothetical protein
MINIIESENYNKDRIRFITNKRACDNSCYLELAVELSNFSIKKKFFKYSLILIASILISILVFKVNSKSHKSSVP